ncbi:solute carrier family 35 member G1-like [Limulus polyphemus]|uniref:Solute carrier family 35 member G1-like n=1 Tax=Limulus polyphemus TaxID=6850 RepID=A0ABM1TAC0_LIMPO|nr:solute carrier family 35 member G1-like [Limulus polyphemus]
MMKCFGVVVLLIAATGEGFYGLVVQLIDGMHIENIIGLNNLYRLLLLLPIVLFSGSRMLYDRKTMLILLLRGILGSLALSLLTYSYTLLPIGDAASLYFCSPLYTMLFSICLLKHRCKPADVLAVLLCLLGVVLLYKPAFLFTDQTNHSEEVLKSRLFGAMIATCGALCDALLFVCSNSLCKVHYSVISFYTVLCTVVPWTLTLVVKGIPTNFSKCSNNNLYLIFLAVFGVVILLTLNRGLQLISPGPASIIFSMAIPIGFLVQVFIKGNPITLISGVGALAIFTSVLISISFGCTCFCEALDSSLFVEYIMKLKHYIRILPYS